MKKLFSSLIQKRDQIKQHELIQEVSNFTDFIIKQQDETLLSVSKGWSGYGTWKASVFVNEYHYGDNLAGIIGSAINGKITHDEDKEFTLEDFRERLEDEIFEYIYHYEEEE